MLVYAFGNEKARPLMTAIPTVLFVCVHNAGRSQMAAGYLQHLAGDRIDGEIGERLVDDEHASGTAQLLELRARVEHARRVRRVAEDDEIGAVERRDVSVAEVRTGADIEHVRPGRAPGAA